MFTNEPLGKTKFELIGAGKVRITPEGQPNAAIVIPASDLMKFALELPVESVVGMKVNPNWNDISVVNESDGKPLAQELKDVVDTLKEVGAYG